MRRMGWEGDAEGQSDSPRLQAAFPGFAFQDFLLDLRRRG